MVDVVNRLCALCPRRATFGYTSSTHCRQHKESGMTCSRSKRCQQCNEKATVGYATVTHCSVHGKEGMVDLSIRCLQCGRRASYGIFKAARCKLHRLQGDRKLNCLVCEADGCVKKASFDRNGTKSDKPLYCKYHIPITDPIQLRQLSFGSM